MRGRNIDTDFVINFIEECIVLNKNTTKDICEEARSRIFLIDKKIKEIDLLKEERLKLKDVLDKFNFKLSENSKIIDKSVTLLTLDKELLLKLREYFSNRKKISISDFQSLLLNNNTKFVFIVKQFIEFGVLSKNKENFLQPGPNWEDYIKDL